MTSAGMVCASAGGDTIIDSDENDTIFAGTDDYLVNNAAMISEDDFMLT